MPSRLIEELRRLYLLADQRCVDPPPDGGEIVATPDQLARMLGGERTLALAPVAADGTARAMVVCFEYATDWERVAALYQAVQEDLALPAPAVSISGSAGFQLWFSFADPVAGHRLREFLGALRRNCLRDVPADRFRLFPDMDDVQSGPGLVPALWAQTGKWSAFIDPGMGRMFVDEPGLEMAPNMDRQADILAGLKSIEADAFAKALGVLQAQDEGTGIDAGMSTQARLNSGNHFSNPKDFLLAVMNDPSASTDQRIEAAKALLPYFGSSPRG
jgi:hypothetical protein